MCIITFITKDALRKDLIVKTSRGVEDQWSSVPSLNQPDLFPFGKRNPGGEMHHTIKDKLIIRPLSKPPMVIYKKNDVKDISKTLSIFIKSKTGC